MIAGDLNTTVSVIDRLSKKKKKSKDIEKLYNTINQGLMYEIL